MNNSPGFFYGLTPPMMEYVHPVFPKMVRHPTQFGTLSTKQCAHAKLIARRNEARRDESVTLPNTLCFCLHADDESFARLRQVQSTSETETTRQIRESS